MRTDTRMRLHRELGELLHRAHADLRGSGEAPPSEPSSHLPSVLEDVLVDPDLHTDARLRLHHEIQEILRRHGQYARVSAPGPRPAPPRRERRGRAARAKISLRRSPRSGRR